MDNLKISTINFSRISNVKRILEIWEALKGFDLDICCAQEIDIYSAIKCFGDKFNIIVNWDLTKKCNI